MSGAVGKNIGTVLPGTGGTVSAQQHGSVLRKNPKDTADGTLAPLGRRELIEETQAIVLQFPIKVMAELQDSTERAVESQRNGESSMSLLAAANAARANPRVRAMLGRLLGSTGRHTDPDFMEGLEQVVGYMLRQQQQAEDGPVTACDDATADLFGGVH